MAAPSDNARDDRPPRCDSEREYLLLRRMCARADIPFTEWDCARLLTEFKRNLTQRQWVWMRERSTIKTPEDALRTLILIGFENRRLKRMRLRGRGRDRVWAEPRQQARLQVLFGAGALKKPKPRRGPGPNGGPPSKRDDLSAQGDGQARSEQGRAKQGRAKQGRAAQTRGEQGRGGRPLRHRSRFKR